MCVEFELVWPKARIFSDKQRVDLDKLLAVRANEPRNVVKGKSAFVHERNDFGRGLRTVVELKKWQFDLHDFAIENIHQGGTLQGGQIKFLLH